MLCRLSPFRCPAALRDLSLDNWSSQTPPFSFHMEEERDFCGWRSGIAAASKQMDVPPRRSALIRHRTRTPYIYSSLHHTFLSVLNLCLSSFQPSFLLLLFLLPKSIWIKGSSFLWKLIFHFQSGPSSAWNMFLVELNEGNKGHLCCDGARC